MKHLLASGDPEPMREYYRIAGPIVLTDWQGIICVGIAHRPC